MEAFSRIDLVSFGNYLLSEERRQLFVQNPNFEKGELLEERLKHVHNADIENWKELYDKKGVLNN